MNQVKAALVKIWLLSIGGALVALFLLFFGLKFLARPNDASDLQLILLAALCVFCSVALLAAKIYIPKRYKLSALFVLLAAYFCARAAGVVEGAWLMRILGILSLGASGIIIYITYTIEDKIRTR